MSDFVASPRVVLARPASRIALWWPSKGPSDVADYDVDWTWRLYSAGELAQAYAQQRSGKTVDIVPADKIAASTFLLSVGSLEAPDNQPSMFVDRLTKIWLAGGDERGTYAVVNRITTAGGRTLDQTALLKVKTK